MLNKFLKQGFYKDANDTEIKWHKIRLIITFLVLIPAIVISLYGNILFPDFPMGYVLSVTMMITILVIIVENTIFSVLSVISVRKSKEELSSLGKTRFVFNVICIPVGIIACIIIVYMMIQGWLIK